MLTQNCLGLDENIAKCMRGKAALEIFFSFSLRTHTITDEYPLYYYVEESENSNAITCHAHKFASL